MKRNSPCEIDNSKSKTKSLIMKNSVVLSLNRETITTLLVDIMAVIVILFAPAVAHLMSFPVFFVEPMRIMLVLALVHTNKKNAYAMAVALPIFSFMFSAHPVFLKALLMSAELALNVYLFYELSKHFKNVFTSVFFSIVLSKLGYYAVKIGLLQFALINSPLVSIPIWIQLLTASVFALYAMLILKPNKQ